MTGVIFLLFKEYYKSRWTITINIIYIRF